MLKLRLLTGPRAGRHLRVHDTKPVSIGRRVGRLRLHDSRVSKHHAEIYYADGTWVLRDLGSANGTFINRERVDGIAELEGGDLIQMGRVLIKVRSADGVGMDPIDAAPQDPVADAMDDLLATTPDPAPTKEGKDSATSSELLGDEIDIQAMLTELDKKAGIDPDDSDFDLETPDEKASQDAPTAAADTPAAMPESPPDDPDSDLISLADEDPPAPRPGTTVITAIEESSEASEQKDDAEESGIDEVFAPTPGPAAGQDDDAADQISIGDEPEAQAEIDDALEVEDAAEPDQADDADDKPELVGLLLSQKPPQQPVIKDEEQQENEDEQVAGDSAVDEAEEAAALDDTEEVDDTLSDAQTLDDAQAFEEPAAAPLDPIDELDESPSVFDIAADPDFELDVDAEAGIEPEQIDIEEDAISDALEAAIDDVADQAEAIEDAEPELEADASTEAETEPEVEVDAEPEVEDQGEAEVDAEFEAEAEDASDTDGEVEATTEASIEAEIETEAEPEAEDDLGLEATAEPEAELETVTESQTEPEPESPEEDLADAATTDDSDTETPAADAFGEELAAGTGGDEGPDFDIDAAFNALSAGLDDSFRLPAIDSDDEPSPDEDEDDPWSLNDAVDAPEDEDTSGVTDSLDAEADADTDEESDGTEASDHAEAGADASNAEAELLAEIAAAPDVDPEPEKQAEHDDEPEALDDTATQSEAPDDQSDQAATEQEDTDAPAEELLAGSQLDVGFIQDALARMESDEEDDEAETVSDAKPDAGIEAETDSETDGDSDSASDLQALEDELLASLDDSEDEADDGDDLDALAAEFEAGSDTAADHEPGTIQDETDEDADDENDHALADLDTEPGDSLDADDETDTDDDEQSGVSDSNTPATEGLVIPQSQATPPGLKAPTTVLPEEDSHYEYEPRDAGKPGLWIFVTVVLLCVLIGGGWFGYQAYLKSQTNGTGANTSAPQQPPAGSTDVRTGDPNPDTTTPPPTDPTDPTTDPITPVDNDPSDPSDGKTTDGDPKDPTADPTGPKSDPSADKTDPADDPADDPNAPNPFSKGPVIEGGDAVTGLTLPDKPNGTGKQPDGTDKTTAGTGDGSDKTPEVKPRPLGRPVDEVGKVVFLVDASGSLVDTMPQMLLWLSEAVKTIRPNEQFAVVFFKAGRFIETEPKGLQSPTKDLLTKLGQEWLDPEAAPVLPTGRSDPREAIKHALGLKPTDIYLLSDESFGRFAGDTSRDQAIELVTQAVGETKVRVHGVQFFYDDKDASVLQALSNKFSGTYEFVKEDVIKDASPSDLLDELDRDD